MEIFASLGHATLVVKFIVLTLICMSVFSWAVIIWKLKNIFLVNNSISKIYTATSEQGITITDLRNKLGKSTPEQIISNTINLSVKFIGKCKTIAEINHAKRIVQDSANSELYNLKTTTDKLTSSLATIGMIAPYIGLLGTVWGLLDAFQNLAGVKVVTFQTVAPSIVEALFATAIGLFVAIPASAGYNILSKQTTKLVGKLSLLNDSLINQVAQRRCSSIQDSRSGD